LPVTKHGAVLAKQMALPLPWDAVLLPVSAFPIPKEELAGVATFVRKLGANVAGAQRLSSETFIQVEQSDDIECRRMYSQRAREWIPEVGLGVWPDREPPVAWTQEEFMSLLPGMKPRRLMHQVLRITGSAQAKSDAIGAMLPFGPLLQIMTVDDGETFLQKATALLLPPIKDPSFNCYPFYVPLLDEKGLTSATEEQLEAWFCGASVYIRESFEDKGILIASRQPLKAIMVKLGGRFEPGETPAWYIPD
jgi:hypothetical protein